MESYLEMICVFAYLIYHRHEADRPGPEEGAGKDWFLVGCQWHAVVKFLFRKKNSEQRMEIWAGMAMLILLK